jgi:hypothetical protein
MSTTDYSSVYTIKDFYQKEILPLYFDTDQLALASVGTLGMFLDITGSTTEDMINIMGRYINESMPGQAELPDFIYGEAANYGVTDILAAPAKMSMLLLVKEDNVIEYSTAVEDHTEFTLDADMSILVDDLRYSIPYNIKIRSTLYNGEYNHMAFYDMDHVNEIASEDVPFIKTMKTLINGDVWLVMRVNVYQYQRKTLYEPINTNSILNIPYIDLNFDNQLCNFEVFYSEAGSSVETQLTKKMDTTAPITSPFCYYKMTGDDSFRLSFANDDRYWVPAYNSTLKIYVYMTNGAAGNFGFFKDGIDVSIRAATDDESIAYNRNIFPMGLTQGSSSGGRDQLTLDNIKRLTAEAQVTVKSYTTDNDLTTYFTNFASIYEHSAVFVKQRDDYAGREYGCFTRIGDGIDIFPTNTLNVRLAVADVDEHFESLRQYIVKPGTVFRYEDDETASIVVKKHADDPDEDIEYALSALMVITTKPNKVNYYMNTVNKNVEMDYTYFNLNSPFNFVINNLNICRDAIHGEDGYTITLKLARVDGVFNDIQSQNFQLQSSNGDIDTSKMEVLIVFNTVIGNYVRMTYDHADNVSDDYIYTFIARIGTSDMIDNERILLTGLSKREDDGTDERLIDMMSPDLHFAIFYVYDDQDGGDHNYTDIDIVKDSTLCNIYTPQENEFYFAYPLNLVRSHVVFEDKPETSAGFGFFIKQVPLFGAKFLMSDDCDIDQILTDISSEHDFLTKVTNSLHGMFTINMKFYCTYGRSRSFYIGYGQGEEIINRVNCDIAIGIKFYSGIIQEDYLEQVRIFIKDFFEKINKLSTGTNQAFISILDYKLHNTFTDQIEYAIFYSINGYDSKYQVIRMINEMDDSPQPDFVPEYLTLKASDVTITTL